ncbi:MAG TPA: DUF417 family protein [Aliidongia sp.]|nr:DUF417 family protein [Aliidongia sp.]
MHMNAIRIAIAIIFLWIGALKFVSYEADSITPFVANSPVMSFFHEHPAEHKAHLTHEGELKPAERLWRAGSDISRGLGAVELAIGGLTPFVMLSFLVRPPRPESRC